MTDFWADMTKAAVRIFGILLFLPVFQAVLYIAADVVGAYTVQLGTAAAWVGGLLTSVWLVEDLLQEQWAHGAVEHYLVTEQEDRLFWGWWTKVSLSIFCCTSMSWITASLFFQIALAPFVQTLVVSILLFSVGTAGLMLFVRVVSQKLATSRILQSVLLLPFEVPLVIASTQVSGALFLEKGGTDKWMLLSAFFCILYTILSSLIVPRLLRD